MPAEPVALTTASDRALDATDCVLAVDSGGSKTVCLLARADGTVMACGRGPGVAAVTEVPGTALVGLSPIVSEVLGARPRGARLLAVYACLGGLNTADVGQALRTLADGARVVVARESSGDVVCTGAPHWGFDLAVMAGTGSIAVGVSAGGDRRVAGGWGPLVHDRGSGYDIGRQALRAIAESLDGSGPATALLPALGRQPPFAGRLPQDGVLSRSPADLSYAQRLAIKEAVKSTYPRLDRAVVAGLFPLVAECARQGDAVACTILREATSALAALACALVRDLDLTQPRVLPMGGVFAAPEPMLAMFTAALLRGCPGSQVVHRDFSLVRGAVVVALRQAGLPVDAQVVDRVRASAATHGA